MIEVVALDEFRDWYRGLSETDAERVTFCVELLQLKGVALGHPYSSSITTSKHAMRELRVQAAGRPLRVFYAFDPGRNAVVILGGDKTGNDDFYKDMVPQADRLFEEYLSDTKQKK